MSFLPSKVIPQLKQAPHLLWSYWIRNYAGKPYVPLIKFRYSGPAKILKKVAAPSATAAAKKEATTSAKPPVATKGSKSAAIEDWAIPKKYQRKRMSQAEMDYINSGGPP